MKQSTAWALVGAQFGLLVGLVVLPAGELWNRGAVSAVIAGTAIVLGAMVGLAGGLRLGKTLTPLPIPKDDGELITSGVYGYVRHPLYTGVLLVTAGLVVWGASIAHVIGWFALWAVLMTKASAEEKMLHKRYREYQKYASMTGRLIPKRGRGE